MSTTEACKRLHTVVNRLPAISAPRQIVFQDGIYFHQERAELSGCQPSISRIVRCGSHDCPGRLKPRAWEHKTQNSSGSAFVKHVGSSLINRDYPNERKHLVHWGTGSARRCEFCGMIVKFSRGYIRARQLKVIELKQDWRRAERIAIGILAHCELCKSSEEWLGHWCENREVKECGLWNDKHVELVPTLEEIVWFFEHI